MSRPTKKRGGDTMEAVEFRGGDYQKPKPIWPRWADAALVEAIAADLRECGSEVAASLRAGLSRKTVTTWLSRYSAAIEASTEDAEGKGAPVETDFVRAVSPIARAWGDWIHDTATRAQAGDAGAMWAIPRRVSDEWGSGVDKALDAAGPDAGKAIAGLLGKLVAEPTSEP